MSAHDDLRAVLVSLTSNEWVLKRALATALARLEAAERARAYLGKPTAFWYELLNLSRERGYEEAVDQIVLLRERLEAAENQWRDLKRWASWMNGLSSDQWKGAVIRICDDALAREEKP